MVINKNNLIIWNSLVFTLKDFYLISDSSEIDEGIPGIININKISTIRISLLFDDTKHLLFQYRLEIEKKLINYNNMVLDRRLSISDVLKKYMLFIRILNRSMAHYAKLHNIKFLMIKFNEKDYMPWKYNENFKVYEDNISQIEALEIYHYGKHEIIEGFVYKKYETSIILD
jgi:hypothetical protein